LAIALVGMLPWLLLIVQDRVPVRTRRRRQCPGIDVLAMRGCRRVEIEDCAARIGSQAAFLEWVFGAGDLRAA
jgi:hypothetical protein